MSQTIAQRKALQRYVSHKGRKIITVYPSGKKDVKNVPFIIWLVKKIFGAI